MSRNSSGQAVAGATISTGLFAGLIFGLLSFTGYDVISTLAEETRTPRALIPRATLAACLGVGLFWIVMSWFYTLAVPIADVARYTTSGVTPITRVCQFCPLTMSWAPGTCRSGATPVTTSVSSEAMACASS